MHPRGKASQRVEEVRAVFAADYLTYQYCFVEFFLEHLSDISRAFRGDLQTLIVLALIGQVQMRAMRQAATTGQDPCLLPPERLSISASRIADVTGIPRQTVRRKFAALERKGWVMRTETGAYRLAMRDDGNAPARIDLEMLDRRAMVRVARLFRDLEAIVAAQPRGGPVPRPAQDEQVASPPT
ncbi:hypothetical protein [Paracoccus benzoatiresistens]|uniref:HTH iclR-type domain-containing protein n=1 Tax=Paracoccus benzoatiresistens TaxID=2997341 RepID=A0ABT4JBY7_9RHOB|nr:hypothetical protein [Paracoccus sp. EF6]MCZ0964585.1 hypothetical protein [Paracoccus sp. EF6]